MEIQTEKMELLSSIIIFMSNIVMMITAIQEKCDLLLYISLICAMIVCLVSCIYWSKRYTFYKKYKFVRYLFFEGSENKFNIAPKILLYSDIERKRNCYDVKELCVEYILTENNGVIDSNVSWNLTRVSNVRTTDFYLYTGIDFGTIQEQKLIVTCNDEKETIELLSDNRTDSENGISLCHWDIPTRVIKDGKKIDQIELLMQQKDSFDFSRKEVIYLFPWNYAKKIDEVKLRITYPDSLGIISMQLFEVGKIKGKKFPVHTSLKTISKGKLLKNHTYTYEFEIGKEHIQMNNLYYILLHKR